MKVTHFWSDEDTVFATRFDDGWIVAATEKAAATEGVIVGVWWKEEPTTQPTDAQMDVSAHFAVDDIARVYLFGIFRVGHYQDR